MDLQFNKSVMPCLRMVCQDTRSQEQTLEIKLGEEMPDIGNVVACWGQVIIRGKEWHSDGIRVSGGVMSRVLYQPEDGSPCRCMEGWIPFQLKWDFEDKQRDGTIHVSPCIRNMDARSVSARKIMVRVCVAVMCEAYVPDSIEQYNPGEVPEDIHLLKHTHPVVIPTEAGEKAFEIEETLSLPASAVALDSIIRHHIQTELIDCKVMTDKVVFRGMILDHLLYLGTDGILHTCDFEVPFSQFVQLENDNESDLPVRMHVAITNSELDKIDSENLTFKVNLTGQYVVYSETLFDTVEDVYSNLRTVQIVPAEYAIPAVVSHSIENVRAETELELALNGVVDVAFYPESPRVRTDSEEFCTTLEGTYKVLGYDSADQLREVQVTWEKELFKPADPSVVPVVTAKPTGHPQVSISGGRISLRADVLVDTAVTKHEGMPTITGLSLGEIVPLSPERPSIILRKMGEETLWELAKKSGSSVKAIMDANGLQSEPEKDSFLLIPVQ